MCMKKKTFGNVSQYHFYGTQYGQMSSLFFPQQIQLHSLCEPTSYIHIVTS